MHAWMDGWMDVCMYVRMQLCTFCVAYAAHVCLHTLRLFVVTFD